MVACYVVDEQRWKPGRAALLPKSHEAGGEEAAQAAG